MVAKNVTKAAGAKGGDRMAAARAAGKAELLAMPLGMRVRQLRALVADLEFLARHRETTRAGRADIAAGLADWRPMLADAERDVEAGRCPHCGRCDG